MRKDIENTLVNIIFAICVIAAIVVLAFGLIKNKKKAEEAKATGGFSVGFDDDEIYHLNERTVVDFYEPIIEQFNKESQLVVSSLDASIDINLKQSGVFDIDLLNKSQKIKYKGTGRFYIDMSSLSREDISIDDEEKIITIRIPHTKLLPIEIDPNRFESEDAKKGLLAFGDLKFTAKEYNDLQTEVKTQLEKSINAKENRLKADDNAVEEIIKIYDPIVKALDDSYSIAVEFKNNVGTTE